MSSKGARSAPASADQRAPHFFATSVTLISASAASSFGRVASTKKKYADFGRFGCSGSFHFFFFFSFCLAWAFFSRRDGLATSTFAGGW